jgi:hypothetical protein
VTTRDPDHDKLRHDLGAHLLGALPPEEAAAVEAHLATCAGCRAERDDLLPAASALGELKAGSPAVPAAAEPAPAGLDALVLGRIERERARETRLAWARRGGLAAVAGAAAALVLVAGLAVTRDDPEPAATPPPMEQVDVAAYDDDVTADAALVNHTWGVEVKLTATGFDDGRAYQVVVVGTDGRRYPAGAFVGTGSRTMLCNLNSAVLRPDAGGFEVRTGQGDVVVSSTFA